MVIPSTQWFGSGFGHKGSTSYIGAMTVGPPPPTWSRMAWQAASTPSTAAKAAPTTKLRFSGLRAIGLPPFGCKLGLPAMLDAGKILVNCLAAGLALSLAPCARAHDIPADVMVRAFVKPEGRSVRLLVRVPMKALRDVDYP